MTASPVKVIHLCGNAHTEKAEVNLGQTGLWREDRNDINITTIK